MNVPVITLEIQAMKHSIKTVISEYSAQIDAEVQAAVDAFCTPENIREVVRHSAKQAIEQAIRETVHQYFAFGAGRKQVADKVQEQLELLDKHDKDRKTTLRREFEAPYGSGQRTKPP